MGDFIEVSFKVPFTKNYIKKEDIEKEVAAVIDPKETKLFLISCAYWGRGVPDRKYLEYGVSADFSPFIGKLYEKLKYMPRIGKVVYYSVHPLFGFGDWLGRMEPYAWDFKECLFWLNFFSPEQVKKIGKQKLLNAPAFKVEELKDGGVFIQASELPIDLEGETEYIKAKIRIAKHLGFERYLKEEKERLMKTLRKEYVEELFK